MIYEYIRGMKVKSNEHMLSAKEIARAYGVYTLNNRYNSQVITAVLKDRSFTDAFYYITSHGVMQVYPFQLYGEIIPEWLSGINDNVPEIYYSETSKKKINFIVKRGE